jgi:hypothetical protein
MGWRTESFEKVQKNTGKTNKGNPGILRNVSKNRTEGT